MPVGVDAGRQQPARVDEHLLERPGLGERALGSDAGVAAVCAVAGGPELLDEWLEWAARSRLAPFVKLGRRPRQTAGQVCRQGYAFDGSIQVEGHQVGLA